MHNSQIYIKKSVLSIQNQDLKDLEIILVNDFSTDNTSNIIEEIKKLDIRIKILNNKKNMGTLYSRSIGSLYSRGKYIFPLDSDELVLNKDIFDILYNETKNEKIDIVLFKSIFVQKNFNNFFDLKYLSEHRGHIKKNYFLKQPKLGDYAIGSVVIYGKFIKTKLYKKSIIAYGKLRYSYYLITYEDSIINYIIHQYAKTSYFIIKYGLLILILPISKEKKILRRKRFIWYLKYLEVLFEFSRNNFKSKLFVISNIYILMKKSNFKKMLSNVSYKGIFKLLIRKILNSKYVNKKNKEFIKKKCSKFNILI